MNAPGERVGSNVPNSYGVNSMIGEVTVTLIWPSTRLSAMMIGNGARDSANGRVD